MTIIIERERSRGTGAGDRPHGSPEVLMGSLNLLIELLILVVLFEIIKNIRK